MKVYRTPARGAGNVIAYAAACETEYTVFDVAFVSVVAAAIVPPVVIRPLTVTPAPVVFELIVFFDREVDEL
jgi:hypothetical protein